MKMFGLRRDQRGELNPAGFLLVLFVIIAIGVTVLGGIYFSRYTVLQREFDDRAAEAVTKARADQKQEDEAAFRERQKEPFRSYKAPGVVGDIEIKFPKTWNVYAVEEEESSPQLDITFHPDIIRASQDAKSPYALRLKLERTLYPELLNGYEGEIKSGGLKAKPVTASGVAGTQLTGQITPNNTGVLVILPIRDKTLSIWTESNNFLSDFSKILEQVNLNP